MLACFSYLIMILLCLTQIAHAQHFSIRRYGVSEGLGNNHVNCIFQDSKGYLWFGTWEGYVNMMKDPSLARSVPRFMVNDPRSHTKPHQAFSCTSWIVLPTGRAKNLKTGRPYRSVPRLQATFCQPETRALRRRRWKCE